MVRPFIPSIPSSSHSTRRSVRRLKMTIYHIVSFKVPGGASAHSQLTSDFFSLKDTCVRPTDAKPYISAIRGGRQSSKEGKDQGMDVVFILEFDNDEDLQYYLWKDPAHDAFKNNIKIDGVVVLDFTDIYPNSS
ncbi:hypothetical protein EHS25_003467 [Saitozyma podzolica]|uniref:Stress-response A/B barrel domain-containing protein n=1 Tax=Saitozyma podzolica TaxID=1890683 RepID=A0A427Y7B7_9TREE|nr:hypothetical protein EHS25_003467 [Saitozyma podzolica]